MTDRIKMIWDFHGPNAENIAAHHAKHLNEFLEARNLENAFTGQEGVADMHHIAFMVVEGAMANNLRETLKPNRGQYYEKEI